jgi:hypothetical protein
MVRKFFQSVIFQEIFFILPVTKANSYGTMQLSVKNGFACQPVDPISSTHPALRRPAFDNASPSNFLGGDLL